MLHEGGSSARKSALIIEMDFGSLINCLYQPIHAFRRHPTGHPQFAARLTARLVQTDNTSMSEACSQSGQKQHSCDMVAMCDGVAVQFYSMHIYLSPAEYSLRFSAVL